MSHWPIVPILIPLAAAIALLLARQANVATKRLISFGAVAALVGSAVHLLMLAGDGTVHVYRLGNWPAPYGIVLVLDRLAAVMVALTAALALPVVLAAMSGTDTRGRHFHVFLQLEIAGLTGAFLTGDVFNLFVFFEILLIASYALLLHGGGLDRVRSGIAYVVLNLAGSALFLIALGLLYGTLGTLNMADLALVLPRVAPEDQALVKTASILLVTVFLLKAALLPLGFWLPHVYTAAAVPVAALFAIMTKVGIYALLRLSAVGFPAAPFTADLLKPWLPWLAILTIAIGAFGALAAKRLGVVVANIVIISSGTLMAAISTGTTASVAAALYYLPHTTLVTGALFLLAGRLAEQRGALADTIEKGPRIGSLIFLGAAYLVLGVAASGTPPLSGFIGKLMLMQAFGQSGIGPAMWAALILSGFVVALVLARAASAFFWEPGRTIAASAASGTPVPAIPSPAPGRRSAAALVLLVAVVVVLALAARPIALYTLATAEQLAARTGYVAAVLGAKPDIQRERRP